MRSVPSASGMLVVVAAMIAPVSVKTCSFRHSAERRTAVSANDGSAHVFAHIRQPAMVWSRAYCAAAGDSMVDGWS